MSGKDWHTFLWYKKENVLSDFEGVGYYGQSYKEINQYSSVFQGKQGKGDSICLLSSLGLLFLYTIF